MIGVEWLIEVFGCADSRLRDQVRLAEMFQEIVSRMDLKPVGEAIWHRFPESGGVTGLWLLQESHLAIHTFPEYHSACINVFCCTPRPGLDWHRTLLTALGATSTQVRECERIYHRHS
jgi:S-adenosylmethionine decarboxylase